MRAGARPPKSSPFNGFKFRDDTSARVVGGPAVEYEPPRVPVGVPTRESMLESSLNLVIVAFRLLSAV